MENKLKFWFMQFLVLGVSLDSKASSVSAAPEVPCYYIFGDSLVDNGNNNNLNTSAKANYSPYGIDFPQGPTGRFSNGKNLADLIGELLGFENYVSPFSNATVRDSFIGVNYGSGASGILDVTGYQMGTVISMNKQLSNHGVVFSRLASLLGGKRFAKKYLSKCIYAVVIGSNDYLNNYFLPQYYSSSRGHTPEQFAEILMRQYSKQLRTLYRYGARKVAVFPLGQLGCCPAEMALHGSSHCVESINNAAQIFNDKLKPLLIRLNFLFADAKFIYTDTAINSFGNITVLSTPCCGALSDNGQCLPGTVTCKKRQEYMYWDGFHPTEDATLLYAKKAYKEISPLFTNLIDVE